MRARMGNVGEQHAPETCFACEGTGIEEGREWDGERCAECKGKRVLPCMCDECLSKPEVPVP
jgi:hypothetical protein